MNLKFLEFFFTKTFDDRNVNKIHFMNDKNVK